MSSKPGKLTAGKAKERVASLEESISARQHRLDQLVARLERSEAPDERLVTAKIRLERRLALERDQLEKLLKLLERSDGNQPEESGEFFGSEEIDDLHRSFEEVRQNIAQMQARIDNTELPRDLPSRLTSFEERVTRREEVDSELFGQVLSLQTALDQERQTVRRLSRRMREQDQSLDALREAVEDSVVATVDLAERLEELEESLSDTSETRSSNAAWQPDMEALRELVDDARRDVASLQLQAEAAAAREEAWQAERALAGVPEPACVPEARKPDSDPEGEDRFVTQEVLSKLLARLEALESSNAALQARADASTREPQVTREAPPREVPSQAAATFSNARPHATPEATPALWSAESSPAAGRTPAVFAKNGSRSRSVAVFSARTPRGD